jgi:hypothetical protein
VQRPATNRSIDPTIRSATRIAGIGYVALFILAVFANFLVRENLIVADDAAATFANISDSETLFRLGAVAFLAVFLIDVVVAWALYIVFHQAGPRLSLLAAWFRVVYTVFLGVAVVFMFLGLQLVGDHDYLAAFDEGQLQAQVTLALEAFNYTWLIGLAAFGLHLIILGAMMIRSGIGSRLLGAILTLAGVAYLADTTAYGLLSNYADHADTFLLMVAVPSVIGELAFAIWLLVRSRRQA